MFEFWKAAFTSGWGILYIILILALGFVWVKRWGFLASLALLGITAQIVIGSSPGGLDSMKHIFSSSPPTLMADMLRSSANSLGSPGWGILLMCLIVVLCLLPSIRSSVRNRLILAQIMAGKDKTRTSALRHMLQERIADVRDSRRVIYMTVMNYLLVVSLWIGLRRFSGMGATTKFPFLGIPDITVPNWKPVGNFSYYILALLLALAGFFLYRIQKQSELAFTLPVLENPIGIFLGALLISLFVPAGVLLFLLGITLCNLAVLPVMLRLEGKRVRLIGAAPAEGKELEEVLMAMELLQQALGEAPPSSDMISRIEEPVVIPREERPGELMATHSEPLVDIAYDESKGRYYLLDKGGFLLGSTPTGPERAVNVKMSEPLGLALAGESDVIAVDGAGRITVVSLSDISSPEASEYTTSTEIDSFAVNSFGTIVAFVAPDSGDIRGWFVASGNEQVLFSVIGGPSSLAFSADGRFLAVGCGDGSIQVIDMASRRVSLTLQEPSLEGEEVVALAPAPGGSWVAAYRNNYICCWEADGTPGSKVRNQSAVVSMAVDREAGKVAVGSSRGHVRIRPADLRKVIIDEALHSGRVVRIIFTSEGKHLLSAGSDGVVMKTSMRV